MKLYLASYLEPMFHGPGIKYGIATTKPNNLDISGGMFKFLTPTDELISIYREKQLEDQIEAANYFNSEFKVYLNKFENEVKQAAISENKQPHELLPFKDGDTLLSWEKAENTSYRPLVAKCLRNLGYDVELK